MPLENPFRIIRHDHVSCARSAESEKVRFRRTIRESANTQEDNREGARVIFSESKRLIGGTLSAVSVYLLTVTEMLEKPTLNKTQFPIESLLSARLLLEPQIEGDRIYFLSDLAGILSLYSIARDGSIPQPMLPGGLSLVNPHIMPGDNFHVLPKLGKVLVMIDKLGDENYQPNLIPLGGGIPEPLFGDKYRGEQIACVNCDKEKNIAYFFRDNRKTPDIECLKVNLETGEVRSLGTSIYGNACNGVSSDHSTVILADGYTAGDVVLYYWKEGMAARKLLYGVPLDQPAGKQVPLTGIGWASFVDNDKGLFFESTIFHDNV